MSMVEDLLGDLSALKEKVNGFGGEVSNLNDRLSKVKYNIIWKYVDLRNQLVFNVWVFFYINIHIFLLLKKVDYHRLLQA